MGSFSFSDEGWWRQRLIELLMGQIVGYYYYHLSQQAGMVLSQNLGFADFFYYLY